MKIIRFALLSSFYLVAGSAAAQSNLDARADPTGPRAALDRLVALNSASALDGPEGQALLAGELDHTAQAHLGWPAPVDRIIMLAENRAAARIPAQGEERPDIYVYLRKTDGGPWSVTAVRSLALTGVLRELRRGLRALPSRTTEQEDTLANVELTLSSDADLRRWFGEHSSDMDRLRAMMESSHGGGESPAARALAQRLHLGSASLSQEGRFAAVIGGLVDNSVGFLHAPSSDAVPPIDTLEYIWIEPVGDGWYLFKTT